METMRLTAEKLRWGLVGGAALLLLALVASVSYGRYKARAAWDKLRHHSGAAITRETDGFTYSQSVQGKTVFTLHAAKAIQHENGKYTLHDVILTLYGRVENHADRIYGSEFEYDEKEGVARATGEVQMDLEAPQALARSATSRQGGLGAGSEDVTGASPDAVHVRTSGLVYLRKLGVAATDQEVEFRYRAMLGSSRGAEFLSGQSSVRLLADVKVTGVMHGEPVTLRAAKADLERTTNTASFTQPNVSAGDRMAQANDATLHLRHDGSVERAEAQGSVRFQRGTQVLTAARLEAVMNASSAPESARLSGGVQLVDTEAARPKHGSAREVSARFDGTGAPREIIATGGANLTLSEALGHGPALRRDVTADRIVATLGAAGAKGRVRLTELRASGGAKAHSESLAKADSARGGSSPLPNVVHTQVAGDELHATFGTDGRVEPRLQHLSASGHTALEQSGKAGATQSSTADALEVAFTQAGGAAAVLASAAQTGHVNVRQSAPARNGKPASVTTAAAERAQFDASTDKLSLAGGAHLANGQMQLSAADVVFDQRTGDAEAHGGVNATMGSATGKPGAQASHVVAADAHFSDSGQLAEFRGSDAQPARLWQGASQVQAASLLFDGDKGTLIARPGSPAGLIHAVFAGGAEARPGTARTPGAANVLRVASGSMSYAEAQHEAVFGGGVQMAGSTGDVRSQRAVVFLQQSGSGSKEPSKPPAGQASLLGGSLDRVVLTGAVQMEQPGRHGTGEQLTYTAATGGFVLTGAPGKPPRVQDEQQGSVTGSTLLFSAPAHTTGGAVGESTIVVAGEPASASKVPAGRVRTETEVRQ